MENWSRPYYQSYLQRPHLFYAALGDFQIGDELDQMAAVLPTGLDCRVVEASHFREGHLWEMLKRDQPELAREATLASQAFVVQGEVEEQQNLDYLKTTIDFLTYLTDCGGTTVYDPYVLSWFSSAEWQKWAEEGQIFNPFDHVVLLSSQEEDGAWLHTRGMLKYGRPDLSVRGVQDEEISAIKKMIDRFISFEALGGVVEEGREVKLEGLIRRYRVGLVEGDRDDPDFNNFHVEIVAESATRS